MPEQDRIINAYISQLSDNEKKALEIAKQQLGSSFNLKKSIGFLEYKKMLEN